MEPEDTSDYGNGRTIKVPRWWFRAAVGFFYISIMGTFTTAILICFLLGSIAIQQQAIRGQQLLNAVQLRKAREDIERLEKKLMQP